MSLRFFCQVIACVCFAVPALGIGTGLFFLTAGELWG